MYDTIIIGAGMSGLAAGIRLAHFEQRVCILERHSAIGGLNSFYRPRGRNFDVGLHAVTNYAPEGDAPGPAGPAAAAAAAGLGRLGAGAAGRLGDRVPGRDAGVRQRLRACSSRRSPAFPAAEGQLPAAAWRPWPTTTQFGEPSTRARPGKWSAASSTIRCWSEMLFCPLLFYGSAREHDMDFGQFCIMFRSIFLEGLARPLAGVRLILKNLVRQVPASWAASCGCARASSRIVVKDGGVERVVLDDGTRTGGPQRPLLGRLAGDDAAVRRPPDAGPAAGRAAVVRRVDLGARRPAARAGLRPHDRLLQRLGEVPLPAARRAGRPAQRRRSARPTTSPTTNRWATAWCAITALANYDRWAGAGRGGVPARTSAAGTTAWSPRRSASCPISAPAVVDTDMFTPTTIRRFTGHDNGAVYGAAEKRYDGTTHLKNLFVCGTDQGLVGIIGAILSGISVANRHLLNWRMTRCQ